MKSVQIVSLSFLLCLATFIWGTAVGLYQVFPYAFISSVLSFLEDDEQHSVEDKLLSDTNVKPFRFLYQYPLKDVSDYQELQVLGLRARREAPRIKLAEGAPEGYRILFGAFDFVDSFWGALLLDSTGEILHQWRLSSDDLPTNLEPGHRKNMYGVGLLSDGSIIFSMQERSGGLVRADVCSRRVWSLEGQFHHTVAITEDQKAFWTFEGQQSDFDHVLALVEVEEGTIVRRIDMKDVRAANPDIDLFHLQRYKEAGRLLTPLNEFDNVHGNDIEPLPRRLREEFPAFDVGDLLLSFRVINLVLVLDPDTLKIEWWRIGAWGKQHDPDWNKGGFISVFDNNPGGFGEVSHIKAINPRDYELETLVDGSNYDFFSSINGNHQLTEHGTMLITSSTQGRVFEVNEDGEIVFDFLNVYDSEHKEALHMSEAILVPYDFFDFEHFPECRGD